MTDKSWDDAAGSGLPQQPQGYQTGYPHPYPQYPPPNPYSNFPNFPDPAAPFGRHPATGQPLSDKSKIVAGLLQLLSLLGIGGIGRIYIGDTSVGIAQLLVGWLTCGIGLIWSIVDAVLMFAGKVHDTQGRPLNDDI